VAVARILAVRLRLTRVTEQAAQDPQGSSRCWMTVRLLLALFAAVLPVSRVVLVLGMPVLWVASAAVAEWRH
jgi:hypothetical protein